MKTITTILICLVVTSNLALCQQGIDFNFDQDTNYKKYFHIDSSNVNNIWQVGMPQKTIFNAAESAPNALITDTMNHYPVNDTSSFTIIYVVNNSIYFNISMYFDYKFNSDSLADFGKVDVSLNKGLSWIPCNTYGSMGYHWQYPEPTFTGNILFWKEAQLNFFPSYYDQLYHGDTILFKFTFISDSIDSYKDGWMVDNFFFVEWFSGIDENNIQHTFTVFYKGNEEIELVQQNHLIKKGKTYIEITDLSGRTQYSFEVKDTPVNNFKMPGIKDGIYLYAIKNNNRLIQSGKILVK